MHHGSLLQKCCSLRGKAPGNGCASSPIFTKWFGLGKTTARLASDCRLLGCWWHGLPLSNIVLSVVLLVLSVVLYI